MVDGTNHVSVVMVYNDQCLRRHGSKTSTSISMKRSIEFKYALCFIDVEVQHIQHIYFIEDKIYSQWN